MWEVCISEFHIKHREFLFDFSPDQIFLLLDRRGDRLEAVRSKTQSKEQATPPGGLGMTPADARVLGQGGLFG